MSELHETLTIDGVEMPVLGLVDMLWSHPRIERCEAVATPRRSYRGLWEVRAGRLFLNNLSGGFKVKGAPIQADWVSGTIAAREGDVVTTVMLVRGEVEATEVLPYFEWVLRRAIWSASLQNAAFVAALITLVLGLTLY